MTAKPFLRLGIVDFWDMSAQERQNYVSIFQNDFTVILDNVNPDLLFYSCFGEKHLRYNNCKKLFYSGENVTPDFNFCDYAITTVKIAYDNKCLWIPQAYWASNMAENRDIEIIDNLSKRKFCSFVYSQDSMGNGAKLRKSFCEQLMKYKKVDCPGKVLHNIESSILSERYNLQSWHESKINFLTNYKFNIAFENSEAPGYITEKLVDCYMANTIPIYWGSKGDVYPYPKESMICANDFKSIDELIEKIREIDQNDELYLSMLRANPFRKENRHHLPDFQNDIHLFIKNIINTEIKDRLISYSLSDAQRCCKYMQKLNRPHIKYILKIEEFIKKAILKIHQTVKKLLIKNKCN